MAYLGQKKKKCFTDSESIAQLQIGDAQRSISNKYSLRRENPSVRSPRRVRPFRLTIFRCASFKTHNERYFVWKANASCTRLYTREA